MNKDRLTKERRSWNMSRIRGKDTTPEMRVRSILHRLGFRFRLHVRIPLEVGLAVPASRRRARKNSDGGWQSMRGAVRTPRPAFARPDILLPRYKTAIFIHGCFWHRHRGCKNCTTPTNRREWWLAKLNGNAVRDKLHQAALQKLGWHVIVIWECETQSEKRFARFVHRLAFNRSRGATTRR